MEIVQGAWSLCSHSSPSHPLHTSPGWVLGYPLPAQLHPPQPSPRVCFQPPAPGRALRAGTGRNGAGHSHPTAFWGLGWWRTSHPKLAVP